MSEAEVHTQEVARVRDLIAEVRQAVEVETASETVALGRWGSFSADWNKRRMAWVDEIGRACVVRSRQHRQVHLAAARLFPAWQAIHYTLTRGKPADLSKLDAVEAMVDNAAASGE